MKVTRPTKQQTIIICIIAFALLGGGIMIAATHHQEPRTPTHATLVPAQKSVSDLGGWQRISPPGKDPVFAYSDSIDGVRISVSQQAMPASFKGDIAQRTANLARDFQATRRLDVGGTIVYIGTSAKGPQSAIFTKNNLLIFIKSEKTISDAAWSTYVSSLQTHASQ